MTAHIQPIDSQACDVLSSIHAACFARGWSSAEFHDLFAHSHVIALACFLDQTPVGFIFGWLAGGDFEILTIAVIPDHRKQGYARALASHAIARARSLGSQRAFLEVGTNNKAALALYTSLSFQTMGIRKGYYHHPNGTLEDALTMHCGI